jgi:hypothetical protein
LRTHDANTIVDWPQPNSTMCGRVRSWRSARISAIASGDSAHWRIGFSTGPAVQRRLDLHHAGDLIVKTVVEAP